MFARTVAIASLFAVALAQQSISSSSSTTTAPGAESAETTITALLGVATTGFAGSVVDAGPCATTIAIVCDSNVATPNTLCAKAPGVTLSVTYDPGAYDFNYATREVIVRQHCDLEPTSASYTRATCTFSAYGSVAGTSTSASTVSTVTNPSFFVYAPIPITAGASLLPSAGATCDAASQSSVDAARNPSSDSAARPTAKAELYKILIPVGAAVVAGAGALM